jgi:hypothetical protein
MEANKFDIEAGLLIVSHLIDVDTVALGVDLVVNAASFHLLGGKSVDSKSMVVGLPVDASEVVDIAINMNLLVRNNSVASGEVEKLNSVLFAFPGAVGISESQVETLRVHVHLQVFTVFEALLASGLTAGDRNESYLGQNVRGGGLLQVCGVSDHFLLRDPHPFVDGLNSERFLHTIGSLKKLHGG